MMTPVSVDESPDGHGGVRLSTKNLERLNQRRESRVLAFDVCSVDRVSFSELSMISDDEEVGSAEGPAVAAQYSAASGNFEAGERTKSGVFASPASAPSPTAPSAMEMDTKMLDYVMSRIFASTYHTQAMCLINISARADALLSSNRLSNSVMISEAFARTVFHRKRASANEVLGWLLLKGDAPADPKPEPGPFVKLSPKLTDDDKVFLQDQRRILRRLLMKPRPKGYESHVEAEDRDSDFDDSDSEYDPEEDLNQRTLEEGFCQVLLPPSDPKDVPTIGTLYISTIASQVLPSDMGAFVRGGAPLLAVISVVATRKLSESTMNFLPSGAAHDFPRSKCWCEDESSGYRFQPNTAPCFIRGPQFTGNVFLKTVLEPDTDARIQPYFDGKNRRFEIQIQGRFTPREDEDLTRGRLYFACYLDNKLGGPNGKPLTWFQSTAIGGILGAFKMIARKGLEVMKGDEKGTHPLMAIPLLQFLDRLSIRGDEPRLGESVKQSPPLAVGVAMLPDTPELKLLNKFADKEEKKKITNVNYFEPRTRSYTMSFHSQYVDFECWLCRKLPGFSNIDLHTYWGNQPPQVCVGFVGEGQSAKELKTLGKFPLKLNVLHDDNVAALDQFAAEAGVAAAAEAAAVGHEPYDGISKAV